MAIQAEPARIIGPPFNLEGMTLKSGVSWARESRIFRLAILGLLP